MTVYAPDYFRCVHFRGIQNVCGAGIDPRTVRDATGPGMFKWPCLRMPGKEPAATTCAHLRVMTQAELKAETDALYAAADAFEAAIAAGKCGVCGAQIQRTRTIGKCDYSDPCGHRLGQAVGGSEEP